MTYIWLTWWFSKTHSIATVCYVRYVSLIGRKWQSSTVQPLWLARLGGIPPARFQRIGGDKHGLAIPQETTEQQSSPKIMANDCFYPFLGFTWVYCNYSICPLKVCVNVYLLFLLQRTSSTRMFIPKKSNPAVLATQTIAIRCNYICCQRFFQNIAAHNIAASCLSRSCCLCLCCRSYVNDSLVKNYALAFS